MNHRHNRKVEPTYLVQRKEFGGKLMEEIGMPDALLTKRACSASMKAHKYPGKHYICEKLGGSPEVVFAFAGSWSVKEFFKDKTFGEKNIDRQMFRSMRSIGNDETAQVNAAFAERFEVILNTLTPEVEKYRKKGKKIVFAGHSSGGPMAIFATLWFLENTIRPETDQIPFCCLTFGSPLTGDKIFGHAMRRENWSSYFIHFVMKYDIVPRIMLAPLSSLGEELQEVLNFFRNYRLPVPQNELFQAQVLFRKVMRSAFSVTSHAASILMGCTNNLLETISTIIKLSPYRPFGKYIFCCENRKLTVVDNSDAVLQMLFYTTQLVSEAECMAIALKSLQDHMSYEKVLQESLDMQNVTYLNHLQNLPLSSVGNNMDEDSTTDTALNDLGLGTRSRLCLRAAGELEEQKKRNESRIDSNEVTIKEALRQIQGYQDKCEGHNMNYYNAFKLQNDIKDFEANVKRLELAGIWDEIIELLKRYELPDGFEGRQKWIKLGTEFRQLVEPLDIANYYRHLKNDDTGPYMLKGRPRRYRYTQRWFEHASRMEVGSSSHSFFWADVEELRNKRPEVIEEKLDGLEKQILKWIAEKKLSKHVFSNGSTFAEWWKTLPHQHRSKSCLATYMTN